MTVRAVVSLVPSTTESVCELGAADLLVGCTRYCTAPARVVDRLPHLGGTKNPDREAVLALRPDLVLGNAEENRPEDLEWLRARVPVLVQTPRTVPEACEALRELADVLRVPGAAQPFLLTVEAQLLAATADRIAHAERPLRVCYAVWCKPWMACNRDTFVHDVLTRLGAENVCADDGARYPEFAPAAVLERGVDVVLLPSEPWEFDEVQRQRLLAEHTFGDAALVLCDGRDFCWHGVRMANGLGRAYACLRSARGG